MNTILKSKTIKKLALVLGNALVFLRPNKARQLSENRMTLIHKNRNTLSISEKLMRYALVQNLEQTQDHHTIADANRDFWSNMNFTDYHSEVEDTFESDFLPHCTFIHDQLKEELSKESVKIDRIVEIGTGNGDVLNYLSVEFPQINQLIGIDLSTKQVEINIEKFKNNPRLKFVASDAYDWVKKNGQGNTIFVTSRGVLEYFIEQRLQDFLIDIYKLKNVFFVAIEPNSTTHDFDTDPHTQLYGYEPSFSHNYRELFKNAGFSLWHFSQEPWFKGGNLRTFIGAKNF